MAYEATPSTSLAAYGNIFRRGADIPDADTTIQPFTDRCLFYVVRSLTANRVITLGNTNFYNTAGIFNTVVIWRLDTSANTLTISRADATPIYVDPASPAANRQLWFACSNAGVWTSGHYLFHAAP